MTYCPSCAADTLVEKYTKQGVLVDLCEKCRGVWLDRGEIYLLSSQPKRLEAALEQSKGQRRTGRRLCPRCKAAMQVGPFLDPNLEVDFCSRCGGMWFDSGELQRALGLERTLVRVDVDPFRAGHEVSVETDRDEKVGQRMSALAARMLPLPNLFIRSAGVLVFLYALLTIALIALVELNVVAPMAALGFGIVIVVLQYVLSPWIMDISLRWLYHFDWVSADQLPAHLRRFVEQVCGRHQMKFPSFGLIHDGAPNAFTYGHTPNNMRIVVTQGILDLLEPREVEAVVAHEIGHGKHWDMALMTIAQLVPLLLYTVYRTLIRMRSRGKDNSAAARLAIAVGAYVLYVISEYAVLWFSRCREYHADRFAGEAVGDPGALAAALVKIGYGLAAAGKPAATDDAAARERSGRLESVSALGIFSAAHARSLVMTAGGAGGQPGQISKENLKSAMQWDLWNPWAKFYELHSTHPLIANRLNYLADQAAYHGKEPYIVFDRRQPESYWDDFFVDLGVMFLPVLLPVLVLAAVVAAGASLAWPGVGLGAAVTAFGVGCLLKTWYEYRGSHFPPLSVAALLHKVKVSNVRPVPVRLQGRIIGRGVPGLIWSEDLVLQDETGILFLDYRQPLRIWEWLFGLFRSGQFIGREATITGWFRRAPVPYLEIRALQSGGDTYRSYARYARWGFGFLAVTVGIVLMVSGLG